jgi:hypothetical protein
VQCCIILGPAESLAVRLLMRLRRILQEKHNIIFDTARNTLTINRCELFTVASHNLNKLRSLENPECLFVSEADYMPELSDVRQNCERFIAKSSPHIIYESTIRSSVGLYSEILKEEPSIYKKVTINYLDALREGMYLQTDIDKAKKSRSFAKEFLCDLYSLGNITGTFPPQWVRNAFTMNEDEAVQRTRERIQDEYEDGIPYAYCTHCGKIYSTPETQIVPKNPKSANVCVNCMHNPDNMGRLKTLKPEIMHEIRNDPNSPTRWFWSCQCGYRYLMEDSNLKIQVVGEQQQKSFVKSLETIKKKPTLNKEDVDDLKSIGAPTSMVSERDIPPPGY